MAMSFAGGLDEGNEEMLCMPCAGGDQDEEDAAMQEEPDLVKMCSLCDINLPISQFQKKCIKSQDKWYYSGACLKDENTVEVMQKYFKRLWGKEYAAKKRNVKKDKAGFKAMAKNERNRNESHRQQTGVTALL